MKKRVLFVCIGNSCRSQMAEAFARAYGSDVLEVSSAGLAPAGMVAPLTRRTLAKWNIPSEDLFPKGLEYVDGQVFDVVVNLSGYPVPSFAARQPLLAARQVEWQVRDPIGEKESVYRDVAERIEGLVKDLIAGVRSRA